MKIVTIIARSLLGLIFLVFGLNGFLNFIPMAPPSGEAGQFLAAMFVSHYIFAIFVLEVIAGVLLLLNRFVPLALAILAPILVNIALYHVLMAPRGYATAVIALALWGVLFYRQRAAFAGLFSAKGVS
jgi:putative oxidoreductase